MFPPEEYIENKEKEKEKEKRKVKKLNLVRPGSISSKSFCVFFFLPSKKY
jgi:hypothetical protein